MRPVHEFQANFSQTAPETDAQPDFLDDGLIMHEDDGSVRNLCLVCADGRRAFFNYAYLVAGDLVLTERLNVMLLYFSGQIVTLKGYRLNLIFDLLLNHIPKIIKISNPRYYISDQTTTPVIIEIAIKNDWS